MATFNTPTLPTAGSYREKGSKFLSFSIPVATVEEAEENIQRIKKEYYDSRHVCFAWRIGARAEHSRAFDAGEPAHSAGTPILNEIRSLELSNILIVVVRYFGGTKLGIPGLIEAYREASRDALGTAEFVPLVVLQKLTIRYPYPFTTEVKKAMHRFPPVASEDSFGEDCFSVLTYQEEMYESAREYFEEIGILEREGMP